MEYHVGDPVMHWMHGFGHVLGVEERELTGQKSHFYAISIRDLTVWVPINGDLVFRLRPPTSKEGFKDLFAILSGAGEPLPIERQERKLYLMEKLKNGQAASLCRVLRDLASFKQAHPLNDSDQNLMKRSREALLGEWSHSLAVPAFEADAELHRMLAAGTRAKTDSVEGEERHKGR